MTDLTRKRKKRIRILNFNGSGLVLKTPPDLSGAYFRIWHNPQLCSTQ
jgi:hypothetical protein